MRCQCPNARYYRISQELLGLCPDGVCVALKGRFQAGGLNVVADQYTVYLVFVWAAQNQTGMTVSVSWPSNICPSKSIWRKKEKKKFWSLDSQLWKKKKPSRKSLCRTSIFLLQLLQLSNKMTSKLQHAQPIRRTFLLFKNSCMQLIHGVQPSSFNLRSMRSLKP